MVFICRLIGRLRPPAKFAWYLKLGHRPASLCRSAEATTAWAQIVHVSGYNSPHQTGGRPLPYADPVTADGGMQTFFVYPARFAGVRRRPSDEDEQVAAMYISSWHVL